MKLYLDNAEIALSFEASLAGMNSEELNDLRRQAMTRFTETGIPGPKLEEWKYTNLSFLANENFTIAAKAGQQAEIRDYFNKVIIKNTPAVVFVNGYFYPELSSLPVMNGVDFSIFSSDLPAFCESLQPSGQSSSLNNLNQALVTDGYSMEIATDTVLTQPVQIIHIATGGTDMQSLRTRARIKFGQRSKATIIESFVGAEDVRYWSHMICDVTVEEGAEASFAEFQLQGNEALHTTEFHSRLSQRASLKHVSLQLGAKISRTELINSLAGKKAIIDLSGVYLGRAKQSHDIFTRINHDQPECQSRQLFRGVLDERGKSAFQGKVVVARDAQKTNADQSNKTLLLGCGAVANAKPELLIYADDVKCSHGATVGEVNPDQLFYLRSRGLDETAAKSLLTEAFVSEVFDGLADKSLAEKFRHYTADWLQQKRAL